MEEGGARNLAFFSIRLLNCCPEVGGSRAMEDGGNDMPAYRCCSHSDNEEDDPRHDYDIREEGRVHQGSLPGADQPVFWRPGVSILTMHPLSVDQIYSI